ncbi:MAG: hypothetical protein AVDCRST_MAG47-1051, partial [uncultured Nocardioidaceae bacterium]
GRTGPRIRAPDARRRLRGDDRGGRQALRGLRVHRACQGPPLLLPPADGARGLPGGRRGGDPPEGRPRGVRRPPRRGAGRPQRPRRPVDLPDRRGVRRHLLRVLQGHRAGVPRADRWRPTPLRGPDEGAATDPGTPGTPPGPPGSRRPGGV